MNEILFENITFLMEVGIAIAASGRGGGRCQISFADNMFSFNVLSIAINDNLLNFERGIKTGNIVGTSYEEWENFCEVTEYSLKDAGDGTYDITSSYTGPTEKNIGRSYTGIIQNWIKTTYPQLKYEITENIIKGKIPVNKITIEF